MSRPAPYFGPAHPLADAAGRNCEKHPGLRNLGAGRVACGACWELAIRDDERLVVQCGLPRELDTDPEYVDEIAVDLACRGEGVALTPVELRAAVARLTGRGMSLTAIANQLGVSFNAARAALESNEPAPSDASPQRATRALRIA